MTDGALIGMAMGQIMADDTFRNIIGFKLLQDENRGNDGVGMALLMSNTSPAIKSVSPIYTSTLYRKNY